MRFRSQRGQSLTEYLIIAAIVAIGVIASLIAFSGAARNKISQITNCLTNAGTSGVSGSGC